uniref:Alkylated DNA repair protein AlkB homologue 8 N-terminal domain-containing protein n=1 Tax=Gasterosteus aculeatus aculeatus TaxID=481459 RepID=A0AAQ4RSH4_GASAC
MHLLHVALDKSVSGDGCGFPVEQSPTLPHHLCDSPVTFVDSFRFLGSIITQDLKWELNISSITKKAQQRLFFLRQLEKFNLPKTMMVHFYTAIIESILCSSITVWYAAATAKDKGRLQRVIRSAERVIGCNLPSLQDLFASRSLKRAKKMVADPCHPGQKLFVPLPSGRRLRSIRTTTSRHTNSFFPSAVGLINRAGPPLPDHNTPPVTLLHTAHVTLTVIVIRHLFDSAFCLKCLTLFSCFILTHSLILLTHYISISFYYLCTAVLLSIVTLSTVTHQPPRQIPCMFDIFWQ